MQHGTVAADCDNQIDLGRNVGLLHSPGLQGRSCVRKGDNADASFC